MKKYIACNIEWYTNNDKAIFNQLPKEMEIPEDVWEEYEDCQDEDIISDYLSDNTGFGLFGFELKVVDYEKEEKIMNNIYDNMELGGTYHNDNGKDYIILAFDKDADIAIFLNPENSFTPYIGAKYVCFGSWGSGHYFMTLQEACDWFNIETGTEKEIEEDKTRADICVSTAFDNSTGKLFTYKKLALNGVERIIDEILEKDPQAEIDISIDFE